MKNVTSFKKQIGILIVVAMVLNFIAYEILDFYSQKMGLALYNGWSKSESLTIQQGNLLSAIAKAQRSLMGSDILIGITLFDSSKNKAAISYGQPFNITKPNLDDTAAFPKIQKTGLFSFTVIDRIAADQPFMVFFDFKPKILSVVFSVLIFSIFLFSILLFIQIRKIEKQEAENRETLLLLAIENLIQKQVPSEVLTEKLPFLISQWESVQNRLRQVQELETQATVGKKMSELASQVSHDIRSPLSALNILLGTIQSLSEDKRILVRNAVNRINDIANTLLDKSKINLREKQQHQTTIKDEAILLAPIIDYIVSEKRIQFREKQGIEIEGDINQGYGLFVNINAIELKRTISNLINNSVEAFPNETGKVTVAVRNYDEQASIIIQDNGKGIPEYIFKKLGDMGVSHGKEGTQSGSGLGVYHAKKTVEDSGGKFQIQSNEGTGTTITMTFYKAKAPKWFVEKLILTNNMTIASLDDDISTHQIWKGRFKSKNVSEFGIEHRTFTSGLDFKTWVSSQPSNGNDAKSNRLYLVDYELLNQNATGLDIIEKLGIGFQTILVTSRYEEDKIRERCDRLGVKLMPKAMAGFIPIEIAKPKEFFDGILLDDDSLVHSCWTMDANNKNKKFVGFYNAEDFFNRATEFDTNTKIYVDSNLGNGVKGEVISKKIHALGFNNIYLCTGYQASEFQAKPWIKEIVPKDSQL